MVHQRKKDIVWRGSNYLWSKSLEFLKFYGGSEGLFAFETIDAVAADAIRSDYPPVIPAPPQKSPPNFSKSKMSSLPCLTGPESGPDHASPATDMSWFHFLVLILKKESGGCRP